MVIMSWSAFGMMMRKMLRQLKRIKKMIGMPKQQTTNVLQAYRQASFGDAERLACEIDRRKEVE